MKEEDIRPQAIFNEYLKLASEDAVTYFSRAKLVLGACPACGGCGEDAFEKAGFNYQLCNSCQTLFVNPRPVASAFNDYYINSPSSKYWGSSFYYSTAEARREKIWKPKALQIKKIIDERMHEEVTLIDIGGGYGIFSEEISRIISKNPVVIEPNPDLALACRRRGLQVIENFLEDISIKDLPCGKRFFVSFELFEHLHNPALFLKQLYLLMSPGDLFVFTTLSGLGLDIQVLWSDSKSVMPPHHLNFLNPISIRLLLESLKYQVLEITTPGKLDIDIMKNSLNLIKDNFWRGLLKTATDHELAGWQNWIAVSGRSSHMMVVCRK